MLMGVIFVWQYVDVFVWMFHFSEQLTAKGPLSKTNLLSIIVF